MLESENSCTKGELLGKNILRTPVNLSWLAIFIGASLYVHGDVPS